METKIYSVEDVSRMLNIHPKTIGRYIREGKLLATKIGKTWRITGDALSRFTEVSIKGNEDTFAFKSGNLEKSTPKISVSAVIDIEGISVEDATMLTNTLIAIGNSKGGEHGNSSISVQYIKAEMNVITSYSIHYTKLYDCCFTFRKG